jgi:pimeloyl-ACP methyl ester carboxylesterase
MLKRVLLALAVALTGGVAAHAQAPAPMPAAAANDYTDPATWLCRPGRQDACTVDLDATVIQADGSTSVDRFHADPNAPIDCFYVYPTVSKDSGGNATMAIEAEETNVVLHQFARFGAKCRLYAPMYRQVTITALAGFMTGRPIPVDRALAYDDVLDAWNEYLAHDNHGRGVVLIGHSQGSGVLTQLIAREIDGKPVQSHVISAILMGTALQVLPGKDVGGDFKSIPLCHSASQIGCAIAYSSFRADSPPPSNSLFGKGRAKDGTVAVCTNPAALGGGSGEERAFFTTGSGQIAAATSPKVAWITPPKPIDTPFVEVPGLLTAECISDARGNYLAITVHPTPGGARANDIVGDLIIGGQVQTNWGLHLIDADLNMGNLVDIVGDESAAYLAQGGK